MKLVEKEIMQPFSFIKWFEERKETVCSCPYCGGSMSVTSGFNPPVTVCQKCGCSIEFIQQNLDTNPICPNCHQFLASDNSCSRCGYALGTDFA